MTAIENHQPLGLADDIVLADMQSMLLAGYQA